MYGMVNKAVRGLVIEEFGEDHWKAITEKAGTPSDFVAMQPYDDDVTYKLVGAAVEVLGIPAEQVLRAFGEYWVHRVASAHYADLMNKTGTDFLGFVQNLDHMHSRMKTTFPGYSPPSFRVQDLEDGMLSLDYYSKREGLLPFVEGLLTGLAEHFDCSIEITHVPDDDHPMPCKRMRIAYRSLQQG